MLEGMEGFQVQKEGVKGQLKLVQCQRGVADAICAGIATALVVLVLNRAARAQVRGRKLRLKYMIACDGRLRLRGVRAFAKAVSHRSQDDQ